MIIEREKLEFDSVPEYLPEYVREPRASARDAYTSQIATNSDEVETKAASRQASKSVCKSSGSQSTTASSSLPKSAELEALWPGVSHDIFHAAHDKGPSFYLCIGFMAGAFVSMLALWGYSAVSHIAGVPTGSKEIVVAQGHGAAQRSINNGTATTVSGASGEPEVIIPATQTYEVGTGDTLAGIALKNYKRATPRLLDEICRANNMRNANVLSLGQKILLPEYRPLTRQIATGVNSVQQ